MTIWWIYVKIELIIYSEIILYTRVHRGGRHLLTYNIVCAERAQHFGQSDAKTTELSTIALCIQFICSGIYCYFELTTIMEKAAEYKCFQHVLSIEANNIE